MRRRPSAGSATTRHRWRNWARNQTALPRDVIMARSEADVIATVSRGVAERATTRVVGAGHSFTDIACTEGLLLDVSALRGIRHVDRQRLQVTVGAGTRLHELNRLLDAEGLALPNLGDIDRQTIAGATATGTHGTGAGHQCISASIVAMRLVTGDGGVVQCGVDHRPDLLAAARVGLGALGIATEITLQCVPAFRLHAVEESLDIDEILDGFDEAVDANDHVEFFWFPGTRVGNRKVNNRTDEPVARRPRRMAFVQDEVYGNVAFGAVTALGRRRPSLILPALGRMLSTGGRVAYVAPSHEVFCSRRRVRFVEMEYAVPRSSLLDAFGQVRELVDELPSPVSFPIEVRVLGADDIPLSMAEGRDSGFIAVHVVAGSSHEAYFAAVEAIMADHAGRPHWGKLHRQGHERLAGLYPRWEAFQAARAELDPDGHFVNPYLDRVLGPLS